MSQEEIDELNSFTESLKTSLQVFSVGQFILNLFLSAGLKQLLRMIVLLHFLIFMCDWNILIPLFTKKVV